MVNWLKAFGYDAIVGSDPASSEAYHPYAHPQKPYAHPQKLHALPGLWRDGAEVNYAVPRGAHFPG